MSVHQYVRKEEKKKSFKTANYLYKFELTALLGKRSQQLKSGTPALVPVYDDDIDYIEIAEREIKTKVLPWIVERELPGGVTELIDIRNLDGVEGRTIE